MGELARGGVQRFHAALRDDFDGLADVAELQVEIDGEASIGDHADAGLLLALEAFLVCLAIVRPDRADS